MTQAARDENRIPTLLGVSSIDSTTPTRAAVNPSSLALLVQSTVGILPYSYDYVTLTVGSTTDTYVFKTGGVGGSTVATITITYTDSTKVTISTIART